MGLWKETNINFVGKRKIAFILSSVLIVLSIISFLTKGLNFGIDFKGGILLQLKFGSNIAVSELRTLLNKIGLGSSVIQKTSEGNEIIIRSAKTFEEELDIKENKSQNVIIRELNKRYNPGYENKIDINKYDNSEVIYEKLNLGDDTTVLTDNIKKYMEVLFVQKKKIDIIESFESVQGYNNLTDAEKEFVSKTFYLSNFIVRRIESVGPAIGKTLQKQALQALFYSLIAILLYVWWRFQLFYGIASIIALIHDVVITLGFFSITEREISIGVVAALLTIIGYSLNDSIVISDRIRENMKLEKKYEISEIINISINGVFGRTIITSFTTLITVLALYFFAGEVINDFAFALMVGVIIGTYSSIYIVSPIIIEWKDWIKNHQKKKVMKKSSKITKF